MVIELKYTIFIEADTFEYAVPVEETVVEDGDFASFANKLAVQINFHGGTGCVRRGGCQLILLGRRGEPAEGGFGGIYIVVARWPWPSSMGT